MNVRVLTPALEEIKESALWYDSQASGLGNEFWHLVDERLAAISKSPERFPRSEFATDSVDLRYALVGKFKYVIHFLIEEKQVLIVAVNHAARRPGYWLRRVKDR